MFLPFYFLGQSNVIAASYSQTINFPDGHITSFNIATDRDKYYPGDTVIASGEVNSSIPKGYYRGVGLASAIINESIPKVHSSVCNCDTTPLSAYVYPKELSPGGIGLCSTTDFGCTGSGIFTLPATTPPGTYEVLYAIYDGSGSGSSPVGGRGNFFMTYLTITVADKTAPPPATTVQLYFSSLIEKMKKLI